MITIIDVRTEAEFSVGHIKGAINIPIQEIEKFQSLNLKLDTPIMLYCKVGQRSYLVQMILKENGYTNVMNGGCYIDLIEQFGVESMD